MRTSQGLRAVFVASLVVLGACGSETKSTTSASVGASASHSATEHADIPALTIDQVDEKIAKNDGTFFVFDNNNKEKFDKGHVPGAKWLPIEDIKAADLPPNKDATLLFYCANER